MSLRKENKGENKIKIIEVVSLMVVLCIMIFVGGAVIDTQDRQITEYCIDHPNGSLQGDLTINCSEWLEDHPELVEKCMAIEKEIKEGGRKDESFYK